MKKTYSTTSIILVLVLAFANLAFAQKSSNLVSKNADDSAIEMLNGVYAGKSISTNTGLQTVKTFTYYFRQNGTFASRLNKENWRTRIDGTYSKNGNTITLSPTNEGKSLTMTLSKDGKIKAGNFTLSKLNFMDSIPAKRLDYKFADVEDGKIKEESYDGVTPSGVIIFDGEGNFSTDLTRNISNLDDSVKNDSSTAKKTGGTYLINESVLTLNYRDGKRQILSFFYSDDPEVLAVINGDFYFEYIKEDSAMPKIVSEPNSGTVEIQGAEIEKKGRAILKAANLAQGGNKLDTIQSVKFDGKMKGGNGALDFDVTKYFDITNRKIRYEFRQNGELFRVEQLEINSGWLWQNGMKIALTEERILDLKKEFSTGTLALQSERLGAIKIKSLKINEQKAKVMEVVIDNENYIWIFDKDNYLILQGSNQNGVQTLEMGEDIRVIDEIAIPFSNTIQLGLMQLKINYTSVKINSAFDKNTWNVPN